MASDEIDALALNGRFVGYEVFYTDPEGAMATLVFSLDTRSGKRRGTSDCGDSIDGPPCEVWRVAVGRKTGSLAWIQSNFGERLSVVTCSFRTCLGPRGSHRLRVLDPGPGVSATFLRLRGNTVYWRRDGTIRSAALD